MVLLYLCRERNHAVAGQCPHCNPSASERHTLSLAGGRPDTIADAYRLASASRRFASPSTPYPSGWHDGRPPATWPDATESPRRNRGLVGRLRPIMECSAPGASPGLSTVPATDDEHWSPNPTNCVPTGRIAGRNLPAVTAAVPAIRARNDADPLADVPGPEPMRNRPEEDAGHERGDGAGRVVEDAPASFARPPVPRPSDDSPNAVIPSRSPGGSFRRARGQGRRGR